MTLIVWGGHDRVINVECANVLEKIKTNSKKIVFKEVGHVPQMEVPEKLSEAIKDFIEQFIHIELSEVLKGFRSL